MWAQFILYAGLNLDVPLKKEEEEEKENGGGVGYYAHLYGFLKKSALRVTWNEIRYSFASIEWDSVGLCDIFKAQFQLS